MDLTVPKFASSVHFMDADLFLDVSGVPSLCFRIITKPPSIVMY